MTFICPWIGDGSSCPNSSPLPEGLGRERRKIGGLGGSLSVHGPMVSGLGGLV